MAHARMTPIIKYLGVKLLCIVKVNYRLKKAGEYKLWLLTRARIQEGLCGEIGEWCNKQN